MYKLMPNISSFNHLPTQGSLLSAVQDTVSVTLDILVRKSLCLQQGTLLSKEAFLKDDNEKYSSFQREVHLKMNILLSLPSCNI